LPIRKILIVLFSFIAILFYSCKENPRNFNSSLLGPDQINLVNLDSYVAGLSQNSASFKTVVKTGAANTLILGNYTTKSGNIQQASILMRCDYSTISDSNKSDLLNGNAVVADSWIVFTKTYAFGDTSVNQINFGAYNINTSWTSSGFTSDSLNNFSYDNNDVSGQKTLAADSTNIYKVHINGSAIQSEITNYANSIQDNGLYLKPSSSGNTVWGFGSVTSAYPPALVVVLNKLGVISDTLYFNILNDVSVLSGDIVSGAQDIYLQPGLVGQSRVAFDMSIIPVGSIINQAKLLLTLDRSNTVNGTAFNSDILCYNIADSASKIIDSTMSYITILQQDSVTYEGDITSFVQKWVTNKMNQGLLLTPADGLDGMDIFAFKGSNSSNAFQRPRLLIFYTKK
jgi:hypothetical protein